MVYLRESVHLRLYKSLLFVFVVDFWIVTTFRVGKHIAIVIDA